MGGPAPGYSPDTALAKGGAAPGYTPGSKGGPAAKFTVLDSLASHVGFVHLTFE